MDLLRGLSRKAEKEPVQERRCMSCGNVIDHEPTDVYSRRFCSNRCKETYLYSR